jgi:hypothetical protein
MSPAFIPTGQARGLKAHGIAQSLPSAQITCDKFHVIKLIKPLMRFGGPSRKAAPN